MIAVDGNIRRSAMVVLTGWVLLNVSLLLIGTLISRASLAAPPRRLDERMSDWLADHRTDPLDDLTALVSKSADTAFIIGLIVVILACVAISRRWSFLWLVPVAMAIEITTFGAINTIVGRDRPDVPRLGSTPATSSFPSGHAAAAIVCWVGAAVLLWWAGHHVWARYVGSFGVVMAGAVSFSRAYRGMHYTLDVAFGMAMGVAALLIAMIAVHPRPFLHPSPSADTSLDTLLDTSLESPRYPRRETTVCEVHDSTDFVTRQVVDVTGFCKDQPTT